MPRSIWSGAISFGLVNVPMKVYSAVSPKTVRFHQLDSKTGSRISQKRVNPQTGEEVPYDDLVKGFELTRDRYVVIKPEELDAIQPEKSRTIDIEDFVDLWRSTRSTTRTRTGWRRTRVRGRPTACCCRR